MSGLHATVDSLDDELLRAVLRRVSVSRGRLSARGGRAECHIRRGPRVCRGGYAAALVCRRWRDLAPEAQAAVTASTRSQTHSLEFVLRSFLGSFPNLTALHLPQRSVRAMSSLLLDISQALGASLRHLCVAGECYEFPAGQRLRLPRLEGTFSLPEDLNLLRHLRVLQLNRWSWATRHDPLALRAGFLLETLDSGISAFPAGLASLASLRQLSLRCPQVDALPDAFTRLTRLRVLCLDLARLQTLPADIGRLYHLQTFMLFSEELRELPGSFTLLHSLRNVHLRCGRLSALPSGLDNLSALETLELIKCEDLRTLPEAVARISSLTSLDVGVCLPSLVRHRDSLLRLRSLGISSFFRAELPDGIFVMPRLAMLRLTSCYNVVRLPQALGALTGLRELQVSHGYSLESLPASLTQLTQLEVLSLISCKLLTSLPPDLASLGGCLRKLHLEGLVALTALPPSLGLLSSLRELHLELLPALHSLPDSISCLMQLEVLQLGMCGLDSLPPGMGQMVSLASLEIHGCVDLRALPDSIGSLPSLRELRLQTLPMLERIPQPFGALTGLTSLVILNCPGLRSVLGPGVVSRLRQEMPRGAELLLDDIFQEGG